MENPVFFLPTCKLMLRQYYLIISIYKIQGEPIKYTFLYHFGSYTSPNSTIIQLKFSADMATPQAAAPTEQLNLKVKSQDGEEVFFKIKSTTQLKKLMDAYCQRQSLNVNNVRFLFDGERLHETQTPKDLNMENGDEIDVVIEQVGGK